LIGFDLGAALPVQSKFLKPWIQSSEIHSNASPVQQDHCSKGTELTGLRLWQAGVLGKVHWIGAKSNMITGCRVPTLRTTLLWQIPSNIGGRGGETTLDCHEWPLTYYQYRLCRQSASVCLVLLGKLCHRCGLDWKLARLEWHRHWGHGCGMA
jgi:hypothetical protein